MPFMQDQNVDACDLSSDGPQSALSPKEIQSHPQLDSILRTAALLGAVAVIWLATRPYFGVALDARFYMVEALHTLAPRRYPQDLYFQFGSQGKFSLFTLLYLPLLRTFGVSATAMV